MKAQRMIVSVLLLAGASGVGALEIQLPAESARLLESPLPGYALATGMCYTCHSVDYCKMQPTSSRAYWQATVTKMQKVFAAPVPDEAIAPIVDYLVKTYGAEKPAPPKPGS
jgi:sulfite dehydrogenase